MVAPITSPLNAGRHGGAPVTAQIHSPYPQAPRQTGQQMAIGIGVEAVGMGKDQINRTVGRAEVQHGHAALAITVADRNRETARLDGYRAIDTAIHQAASLHWAHLPWPSIVVRSMS